MALAMTHANFLRAVLLDCVDNLTTSCNVSLKLNMHMYIKAPENCKCIECGIENAVKISACRHDMMLGQYCSCRLRKLLFLLSSTLFAAAGPHKLELIHCVNDAFWEKRGEGHPRSHVNEQQMLCVMHFARCTAWLQI